VTVIGTDEREATRIGAAIADATSRLRAAGSPTPRLDAELLLGHLLDRDRAFLIAHPDEPAGDQSALASLVERRAAGEPVAYLRGFKEWHGIRIRTDRRALIPRPETELVADAALAEIETRLRSAPVMAWDIGTGTGAIAIAIALRLAGAIRSRHLSLVASDLSRDALALAAENLEAHGVADLIDVVEADLLGPAGVERPRPDVVTANLPYVSSDEVDERRGSLGFEPRVALDGGRDGLDQLRRLLDDLPTRAARGATVFLEIGIGQAPALEALAPAGASVQVVADLAGLDRVVRIDLPTLDR
jgi:release factor glutamine methyltransferase